mgnify:CR=1 FL=1
MTTRFPALVTALWVLALSLSLATPLSAAQPTAEQANVVQAMRTMYVAATNDDLAEFHSVTTPEFYAFDNGKRFTGDALMAVVKRLHASGIVAVWKVTEPEVHITGQTAWITYVNKGSMHDSSGTKPMTWLESAVLVKENGNWRIQFLDSTRVPPI